MTGSTPRGASESERVLEITFSLLQAGTSPVPLLLPELSDEKDINIRDATALDTFVTLQVGKLGAHVVQVILELVVYSLLHLWVEAALLLRVPISKVMALAWGKEVVIANIVGRATASVVGPNET